MEKRLDPQGNALGNASLALGIASAALVFGIGMCALTAARQGWLGIGATPLYCCEASRPCYGRGGAGRWAGSFPASATLTTGREKPVLPKAFRLVWRAWRDSNPRPWQRAPSS